MSSRRLALLGFGHVAERGHLPAWCARDDFRIVAVADPDAKRRALAERRLPGVRTYDAPDALLQREECDVVDIAAPPTLHAPLIANAAAAGCHVLCEKPLATSVNDSRDALDAVRKAGVTLVAVHNWKHSTQFVRLAALVAKGAIGRLTHARFETIRDGRAATVGRAWRGEAALAGGGILIDHGWHVMYLLLGLAHELPREIAATVERRRYTGADVEDTVTCQVQFPSVRGEIFLTWAGTERRTRWELGGTEGRLTLEDDWEELERGSERYRFAFPRSLSTGSHHPDWFGAVIDGFVREIEDPTRRGASLAEAESCLVLTDLAYQSAARGGRPLTVPGASPGLETGAAAVA